MSVSRSALASSMACMVIGGLTVTPAHAYKFNTLGSLTQSEFRQVSEDLSATFADKPQAPAAGLGITGFDLSVTGGVTSVNNTDALKKAAGGHDVPASLPVAGVRLEKGLPLDVDLGVSYVSVPGSSASALSGDLKWAFWGGGMLTPAVATRVFYTQVNGLGDMKLNSSGVELSVSKGFAVLTPYAGVGLVASRAEAQNTSLASESFVRPRSFIGLNANFLLVNVGFEADKTGQDTSVNLKLGFRF